MKVVLSKTEREALKAIFRLSDSDGDVSTGAVADQLGVAPGTATATVKKLADRGFVDHRPYRGVELTDEGQRVAVAAIRRHRICERFLSDYLGYTWQEADRLATAFEHDLPQEVEDRLFEALGRPDACPHGFPIPAAEAADIPALGVLYDLEPGEEAEVALPGSIDDDIAGYLDTLGVVPGTRVEVVAKQPFDGPVELLIEGDPQVLGERIARQIYVRPGAVDSGGGAVEPVRPGGGPSGPVRPGGGPDEEVPG